MKTLPFEDHHKDGSVCAKGQMQDGVAVGYWEWFRKDGTKLRSGHFTDGMQTGIWKTYDKSGKEYKRTAMVPGKRTKGKVTLAQIKNKKGA